MRGRQIGTMTMLKYFRWKIFIFNRKNRDEKKLLKCFQIRIFNEFEGHIVFDHRKNRIIKSKPEVVK